MTDFDTTPAAPFGQARILETPQLAAAANFLCNQHDLGEGWRAYPGGPYSIYHTFLAASALATLDHHKHGQRIEQAAEHIFSVFRPNFSSLGINDLANLIGIWQVAGKSVQLSGEIGITLESHLRKALTRPDRVLVSDFASAVAAFSVASSKRSDLIDACAAQLLKYENQKGGWPGAQNAEPSIIPTAATVEALRTINRIRWSAPIERGVRFLNAAVADGGWKRIGNGRDVFAKATVLRGLAESQSFTELGAGISALNAAANDSGGWGDRPATVSTIESTATAIIALVACGENRVVSYRIAVARIGEMRRRLATAEEELAKAQREIAVSETRRNERLLTDRDNLRRRNEALESELTEIREENFALKHSVQDELNRYRAISSHFLRQESLFNRSPMRLVSYVNLFLMSVIAATFPLWGEQIADKLAMSPIRFFSLLIIALIAPFLMSELFSWLRDRNVANRRLRELSSSIGPSRVSSLVLSFADIADQMRPEIREDLVYLLFSRVIDMPPEIGRSYLGQWIEHSKISGSLREQLLGWSTVFLSLDPYGRRSVMDQIRRQALPA